MRDMWREATPIGAIADLRAVYSQAGANRWWLLGLAALTSFTVFSPIVWQSWKGQRAKPEVTYITSWPEHRTDAETQAFIKENQRRKDIREAQLAKMREAEREMYKSLGRASGMDVDAMDKQAAADRAQEEAVEKARIDDLIKRHVVDGKGPAVGRQR
jgi:spermidine/putrescine-binding protein